MNTWLKLLPLEIQEVLDLIEPTEEVKKNETVIGIVSDDLKKLWSLHRSAKKAAEIMQVEWKYAPASDEEHGRIVELTSKARVMELIFWIGVMEELQLWSHPEQCGLRVGWQVVEFKKPDSPFFDLLFGNQQ